MELIKENIQKHRKVYKLKDRYRKIWSDNRANWIINHVEILNKINPGYVLDFGIDFIDYKIVLGYPANTILHSDSFCFTICDFVFNENKRTYPYAHGDWVLSNIIVNEDKFTLIDWDNVGIYTDDDINKKIYSDLTSAFGIERIQKYYDTTKF
jgi:RIO-like serine/threonine protein kinase